MASASPPTSSPPSTVWLPAVSGDCCRVDAVAQMIKSADMLITTIEKMFAKLQCRVDANARRVEAVEARIAVVRRKIARLRADREKEADRHGSESTIEADEEFSAPIEEDVDETNRLPLEDNQCAKETSEGDVGVNGGSVLRLKAPADYPVRTDGDMDGTYRLTSYSPSPSAKKKQQQHRVTAQDLMAGRRTVGRGLTMKEINEKRRLYSIAPKSPPPPPDDPRFHRHPPRGITTLSSLFLFGQSDVSPYLKEIPDQLATLSHIFVPTDSDTLHKTDHTAPGSAFDQLVNDLSQKYKIAFPSDEGTGGQGDPSSEAFVDPLGVAGSKEGDDENAYFEEVEKRPTPSANPTGNTTGNPTGNPTGNAAQGAAENVFANLTVPDLHGTFKQKGQDELMEELLQRVSLQAMLKGPNWPRRPHH